MQQNGQLGAWTRRTVIGRISVGGGRGDTPFFVVLITTKTTLIHQPRMERVTGAREADSTVGSVSGEEKN